MRWRTFLISGFLVSALVGMNAISVVAATSATGQSSQVTAAGSKKGTKYPDTKRKAPKLDLIEQSDADRLNKGLKAIAANQLDEASTILGPLSQGKGSQSQYVQAVALQGMARIAYKNKKLDVAIKDAEKALKIGVMPNDTYFDLMWDLSQYYMLDDNPEKALEVLNTWHDQGRRETTTYLATKGSLLYESGNYEEAVKALDKALKASSNPQKSWVQMLVSSYTKLNKPEEAIRLLEQQLEKSPDEKNMRTQLISLLLEKKDYPAALTQFEQAEKRNQLDDSKSYYNMAKLYLLTGADQAKASQKVIKLLTHAADKGIVEKDATYESLMGRAALTRGNQKQALAHYKKLASIDNKGSSWLMVSQLENSQGKNKEAIASAKKAIATGTKHQGKAWIVIANAQLASDHRTEAINAMRKAVNDPQTHDKAKAWLERAGY